MEQKYDFNAIIQGAQESRKHGVHKVLNQQKEELDTLKLEHGQTKRKLAVYEKREKARADGLKKAAQARKKKGAKK